MSLSPLKIFLLFFTINQITFGQTLKLIHTNDLHSFFRGTLTKVDGKIMKEGGYARVATLISNLKSNAKKKHSYSLTLDAGDFYSGTVFHTLAMQASLPLFPEYEFFTNLQYDAVTLGNHEFDGKDEGFSLLMKKVIQLGNHVPIVSTNFINKSERPYPVLTSKLKILEGPKGRLKVGLLGALGPDGCSVSQANRKSLRFLGHDDQKRKYRWEELFNKLNVEAEGLKKKGAEIIILLLHGGGEEDEKIAKEVKFLDVIIAGHTHQNYFKKIDNVYIGQAGSYGRFVGEINLKRKGKLWQLINEKRHPIDSSIEEDSLLESRINTYLKHVENYFSSWGIVGPGELDKKKMKVLLKKDLYRDEKKSLGQFVMNHIKEGINLNFSKTPIDFYMGVRGLVRKPIYGGHPYSFSELFNILPLGFHKGNRPGYRSVGFYLNKKDFLKLLDFLEFYGIFHPKAVPILTSNLVYQVRSWGIPFINRIHSVSMDNKELPNLIHIGTNTFLYSYLDLIKKKTFGLVEITPRGPDGRPQREPREMGPEFSYFMKTLLR